VSDEDCASIGAVHAEISNGISKRRGMCIKPSSFIDIIAPLLHNVEISP
jgi:hypothetical protein